MRIIHYTRVCVSVFFLLHACIHVCCCANICACACACSGRVGLYSGSCYSSFSFNCGRFLLAKGTRVQMDEGRIEDLTTLLTQMQRLLSLCIWMQTMASSATPAQTSGGRTEAAASIGAAASSSTTAVLACGGWRGFAWTVMRGRKSTRGHLFRFIIVVTAAHKQCNRLCHVKSNSVG